MNQLYKPFKDYFKPVKLIDLISNKIMRLDKFLFCAGFILLVTLASHSKLHAQSEGDYRTVNLFLDAVNWSDVSIWQRYTSGSWVPNPAQGYPGQATTTRDVTIRGFLSIVTLDVSPAFSVYTLDNSSSALLVGIFTTGNRNLTVNEDLLLGPGNSLFFGGTGNLTVTGATVIDGGTFSDTDGTGTSTFVGLVTNDGTWTTTAVTNTARLIFRRGITNDGSFNAGGATFNTNNQTISGGSPLSFANTVTVTGFVVTNNATVSLTNTAASTLTGIGTWTQGTGTLNYAGSTIDLITTFNAVNIGNTVNYNGGINQTIRTPSSSSYHHLVLSTSGNKTPLALVDVNGNLTIQNTAILPAGLFQLDVDGNMTIQNSASLSGSGLIDVDGNISIQNTGVLGGTGNINVGGNWSAVNAASFVEGTRTTTFDGAGGQTINNSSGTETFYHLITSTSGTKSSSNIIDINGNLSVAGTSQLNVSNNIFLTGNWTVTSTNANPFVEGTFTVNLDGAGAQAISTVLAAGETFYNLTLSGGGVKSSSNILDVNGNLLISGTSQFNVNNNISVAGNWTVTSTNADPFVQGTRTVTLNGTTSQTLTTVLAAGETFYNLIINNTFATSPQIILNANDPVTVSNVLTMIDGNINLNGNTFTISSNAAGALSHALSSANGWMYGGNLVRSFPVAVVAVGNVAGFYPLGSAADFRPFFVGKTAGATTTGTITMSHTNATTTTALAPPIADGASTITLRHDAFWDCSSATMTTGTFEIIAGGTGFGTIGSINDLRLTPPAAPVVGTAGVNSNTTTDPRVRRNALTRAQLLGNNFHIGSVNLINSPLPIELIDFSANLNNNVVELNWSTATEIDNDFFTIERATDLEHFEAIIMEDGKGTSKEESTYKRIDPSPAFGRSYYRLKQTDFDGKYSYSNLEVIDYEGPRFATLTAYPNPFKGSSLMIKVEGLKEATDVHVQIINIQGQKVFDKILEVKTSGSITEEILSDTILPAGLYIIKAGETLQLTQKIVVE